MELTNIQKDILKEIGNIGIGNAATALSKVTSLLVDIALPDLDLVSETNLIKSYPVGGLIVNNNILGEIEGNLIFVLEKNEALRLIEIATIKDKGSIIDIDEDGESAIKEIVNIIHGAYLTSLSDFTGLSLMPLPPNFYKEYKKEDVYKFLGKKRDVLEIKTSFNITQEEVYARMWLILDEPGMSILLNKITEKQ
ncbi:hypothetical protein GOV05_00965 [Candidatus Woesearchaeota archaeon]|nr:hypothetical protein [Candidatus Woesearchaeota archaeon]